MALHPEGAADTSHTQDAFPGTSTSLAVREEVGLEAFDALLPEWNALVARTDDQVFYRHEFLRCWLSHFLGRDTLRVLQARSAEGRLVAALPLLEGPARLYGLPVHRLRSPTNSHSCRFDLLAESPAEAASVFVDWLVADARWDLLRVADVPEGAFAWALHAAFARAGLPTGVWRCNRSPWVRLPATLEEWRAMPRRNAKALRRRRRRLQEQGHVSLERITRAEGLESVLAHCLALERRGWKGQRGTAIAQDARTLGFYTSLAQAAARHGYLALYVLRLEGRLIAFQLGLAYGRRYLAMKTAYDEALHEVSPGQLLMESLLEDCVARGFTELDLLGEESPAKLEWTRLARQHSWLFVFRDSLKGRALCRAKFQWVPRARQVVADVRAARAGPADDR